MSFKIEANNDKTQTQPYKITSIDHSCHISFNGVLTIVTPRNRTVMISNYPEQIGLRISQQRYYNGNLFNNLWANDDSMFNPITKRLMPILKDQNPYNAIEVDIINYCLEHDYKYDMMEVHIHGKSRDEFRQDLEKLATTATSLSSSVSPLG